MANLPPSTSEGKASRGGTMLDHLQVTVTSTGEHSQLQEAECLKINLIIYLNSKHTCYCLVIGCSHV